MIVLCLKQRSSSCKWNKDDRLGIKMKINVLWLKRRWLSCDRNETYRLLNETKMITGVWNEMIVLWMKRRWSTIVLWCLKQKWSLCDCNKFDVHCNLIHFYNWVLAKGELFRLKCQLWKCSCWYCTRTLVQCTFIGVM